MRIKKVYNKRSSKTYDIQAFIRNKRLPCGLMRRLGAFSCSLLLFYSALAQSAPMSNGAESLSLPEPISTQQLIYDLAYTKSLLADEYFLLGAAEKAIPLYKEAQQEAAEAKMEQSSLLGESGQNIQLLKDNIAYRLLLAESGLPFWGGAVTRKPVNPVLAFTQLESSINSFDTLVDEVQTQLQALSNQSSDSAGLNNDQLNSQKESDVRLYEKWQAHIKVNRANDQKLMIRDRSKQIQDRQVEIAKEIKALTKQLDAVSEQINKVVMSAASEALGIGHLAELSEAAASGDLKQAVTQSALAMLADEGSELSQALIASSDETKALLDTYNEVKEAYEQGKQLVEDGERVVKLVKTGNIVDIVAAGELIYQNLDSEWQRDIKALVAPPKELRQIIQLAREGGKLRDQVASVLSQQLYSSEAELKRYLTLLLKENSDDFAGLLQKISEQVLQSGLQSTDAATYVNVISQAWHRTIAFEFLDDEAVLAANIALGHTCISINLCRQNLANELKSQGLPSLPNVSMTNNDIEFKDASGNIVARYKYQHLLKTLIDRPIELGQKQMEAKIGKLSRVILTQGESLIQDIVSWVPDASFDGSVNQWLGKLSSSRKQSIKQSLIDNPSAAVNAAYQQSASGFQLGLSAISVKTQTAVNNSVSASAGQGSVANGVLNLPESGITQNEALQNMAIHSALSAAGPYGMAASAALKVIAGFEQMSHIAKEANRKNDEDRGLSVELAHLNTMQQQADFNAALAELDANIAERHRNAALVQRNRVNHALVKLGQGRADQVEALKQKMALVYFKAELLRFQFDLFDRALAFWLFGSTDNRQMEQLIRSNLNWQRFALDSDINLYDWFNPSIQGQRKDLGKLRQHWRQLKELALTVCRQYQCTNDTAVVGELASTQSVSLSTLLSPNQWKVIKRWQKNGQAQQLALNFLIRPEHFITVADLNNVRIVIPSIVGRDKDNNIVYLQGARLGHSGLGWVRYENSYFTNALSFSESTAVQSLTESQTNAQLAGLRHRWANSEESLKPLEGYPLYGLWSLVLQQEQDIDQLEDIQISFIVQHNGVANDTRDLTQLGYKVSCDKNVDDFMLNDFRLLIAHDDTRAGSASPGWQGMQPNDCQIAIQ
ncbi:MAG: hypothetical protein COA42_14985 [Alteromonadaceae bacterium]|nr:MAG: hypothetical protein COA42_14985 [Alteromonadaceae bacterium]